MIAKYFWILTVGKELFGRHDAREGLCKRKDRQEEIKKNPKMIVSAV